MSAGSARRPRPDVSAGQIAFSRLDETHPARGEKLHVALRRRGLVHMDIHRGRHRDRRRAGERSRREQVIGDARGHLRQNIRRAGRDEEQVALLGKRHVMNRVARTVAERVDGDRFVRQARNVVGPTNSQAFFVMTTFTRTPAFCKPRRISQDL